MPDSPGLPTATVAGPAARSATGRPAGSPSRAVSSKRRPRSTNPPFGVSRAVNQSMSQSPQILKLPSRAPDHDLTLVIPAYNEENRLPRTLQQLREYLDQWGINYRVVVADDGSRDGTPQVATEFGPRFSTLSLPQNRGKGRGRAGGYAQRIRPRRGVHRCRLALCARKPAGRLRTDPQRTMPGRLRSAGPRRFAAIRPSPRAPACRVGRVQPDRAISHLARRHGHAGRPETLQLRRPARRFFRAP